MPRALKIRTPALAELARQLRFQPPDAARRQLQRAEELALQLLKESPHEPGRLWPVEWVVFRITGYRPDPGTGLAEGAMTTDDLHADLVALIDALGLASRYTDAQLTADEPRQWLTAEELCARWKISRRTLDRYRPLGLFARPVMPEAQRAGRRAPRKSLYSAGAVDAFARARSDLLAHAASFTRVDDVSGAAMHRRAARYRARLGWSLSRCAARLAQKFDRSAGAVRRAVLAHDATLPAPVFAARARLRPQDRVAATAAMRRGGRVKDVARRTRRSRASVYRMAAAERAARLRGLALPARSELLAQSSAAQARVLGAGAVTTGLARPLPMTIAELIEQAAPTEPPAPWERAVAAAYALLRAQAAAAVDALARRAPRILGDEPDGAGGIDWIETRLRWAARLKAELVRAGLGLALRTVESRAHRSIAAIPPAHAAELADALLGALSEAADVFDASKGGRFAAPAGLALNRVVSKWLEAHAGHVAPGRALPRPDPAHVSFEDPWPALTPWNAWLEVSTAARAKIDTLVGIERAVLLARMGWDARPPRTVRQAAAELGVSTLLVQRAEKRAVNTLV